MAIDDGPVVRAAGYRASLEGDRYRVWVWEGMTNRAILHTYIESLEGELRRAVWEAFGRARSWQDYSPDGTGFWGHGEDLVDPVNLLRMEDQGLLVPFDKPVFAPPRAE